MMLNTKSNNHLKRFPYWLRRSLRLDTDIEETREIVSSLEINTVCQSARCPNIYDCFSRHRCTFLILGNYCTRNCSFCAIKAQKDLPSPNKTELLKIKEAVEKLGIHNVVITSVTRDDLEDGGAGHFADCIQILRDFKSALNIEVLVPDFLGERSLIEKVVFAGPDVFSHNVETVPRLYAKVRPQADYKRSLGVLRYAKELDSTLVTKSGLMVGLGETREELCNVMKDLKEAGCEILTVGQYLKPASCCIEVEEFLHPEEFVRFSRWAEEMGFKKFSCSPFTRSSYDISHSAKRIA